MMDPTKKQIERGRFRAAMRMSPAEKFIAGARLFDQECEIAKADIRSRHPELDEARVLEMLRERLRAERQREEQENEGERRI